MSFGTLQVMSEDIEHLLNQIEHQEIVLPEFQREFTWDTNQSKLLIDSFLEGYPTGSLLLWATAEPPALKNMPEFESDGRVDVLLDGQQRLTVLYLLVKDAIPPYYSEVDKNPRNLYYSLETRELTYYKQRSCEAHCWWTPSGDFCPRRVGSERTAGYFRRLNREVYDLEANHATATNNLLRKSVVR